MSIQHYAVVSIPHGRVEDPEFIFRVVREPSALSYELFDRDLRRWRSYPELIRYTHNGEVGAEPISRSQARAIIAEWRRWYN